MSEYTEYFLNSRSNIVQLELVELTHPNFTQPYRFVRNAPNGITVDLSPDQLAVDFVYYPSKVTSLGSRDDLDAGIRFDLGDLGELIPSEMDEVTEAGGFMTKPSCRYWSFRSDNLAAPIYGPLNLEVPSVNLEDFGASFEARAPQLNSNQTGVRQLVEVFPMLRGFLF